MATESPVRAARVVTFLHTPVGLVARKVAVPLVLVVAAMLAPRAMAANAGDTDPVEPARGWRYRAVIEGLGGIDNLVYAPDGWLYATVERSDGRGEIVRIRDGRVEGFVSGLNRPDGLTVRGRFLYVTEEIAEGRVIEIGIDSTRQRVLATLYNPEGIGWMPDGGLAVSEDRVNGRLVRIDPNGAVDTILGGLNRPEGLCIRPTGEIIFAETGTGRVLSFNRGVMATLVNDLDEPDQVAIAPDGAIWVTEDRRDGRLLRLADGSIETIVSGLRFPQGMVFQESGAVLVAEQGRGRILAIQPVLPPPGKP